jgi:hypothetical protein
LTFAVPRPFSTSQSIALRFASAIVNPSRNPELIFTPSPVYASPVHPAGRVTVSMIGSPCAVANSQSRWSSPGTAMIAPVPYVMRT